MSVVRDGFITVLEIHAVLGPLLWFGGLYQKVTKYNKYCPLQRGTTH